MRFAVSEKEREVTFRLPKRLYPLESVQGAAHVLGDRATAFVEEERGAWVLTLCAKSDAGREALTALGREFVDELLNQSLRQRLIANSRPVFERIVARAVVSARRDATDASQPAAARPDELSAEDKAALEALIAEAERELAERRGRGGLAETAKTWEARHGRSRTGR